MLIDLDWYKYTGYGIGFDARGKCSSPNNSWFGKHVFGADMCSLVHIDNKKKDIFRFSKVRTDA